MKKLLLIVFSVLFAILSLLKLFTGILILGSTRLLVFKSITADSFAMDHLFNSWTLFQEGTLGPIWYMDKSFIEITTKVNPFLYKVIMQIWLYALPFVCIALLVFIIKKIVKRGINKA